VLLLQGHYEKTGSALLAGLLGEYAFRSGDYDAAVKSLAANTDVQALKALAYGHARRGRAKEARAAIDKFLAKDPTARSLAAFMEYELGDAPAVRARLAGAPADKAEEVTYWTAWSYALEGNAAEVLKAVGENAKTGTREGEEDLLPLLEARLFARLGKDAAAARKSLVEVRWKVAGEKVPEMKPPSPQTPAKAVSHGMMQRHVTYWVSVCGGPWRSRGMVPWVGGIDGKPHVGMGVLAEADCAREPQRLFGFNLEVVEGGTVTLRFDANADVWESAEAEFQKGCAALVAEDYPAAEAAFGRALEKEPAWARATLFRAAAKALAPGGDAAAAAKDAAGLATATPDDVDARRIGILLSFLGKADPKSEVEAMHRRRESFSARRLADL
jgi:tetratricopeptide (TPR) repeat protein